VEDLVEMVELLLLKQAILEVLVVVVVDPFLLETKAEVPVYQDKETVVQPVEEQLILSWVVLVEVLERLVVHTTGQLKQLGLVARGFLYQ
jgi:hypothetical protein